MNTLIKNIYCIDINWIDNQILYYSSGGYGRQEGEYSANAKLKLLQELKAQLKPIQPLIEDAFEQGNIRGWSGYPNTDNHTKPNKKEYINTKQFELNGK